MVERSRRIHGMRSGRRRAHPTSTAQLRLHLPLSQLHAWSLLMPLLCSLLPRLVNARDLTLVRISSLDADRVGASPLTYDTATQRTSGRGKGMSEQRMTNVNIHSDPPQVQYSIDRSGDITITTTSLSSDAPPLLSAHQLSTKARCLPAATHAHMRGLLPLLAFFSYRAPRCFPVRHRHLRSQLLLLVIRSTEHRSTLKPILLAFTPPSRRVDLSCASLPDIAALPYLAAFLASLTCLVHSIRFLALALTSQVVGCIRASRQYSVRAGQESLLGALEVRDSSQTAARAHADSTRR